jgi:hypothetical protein
MPAGIAYLSSRKSQLKHMFRWSPTMLHTRPHYRKCNPRRPCTRANPFIKMRMARESSFHSLFGHLRQLSFIRHSKHLCRFIKHLFNICRAQLSKETSHTVPTYLCQDLRLSSGKQPTLSQQPSLFIHRSFKCRLLARPNYNN